MPHTPPEFVPIERRPRRDRELRTIDVMARMHCRDRHGSRDALCDDCVALVAYAARRLERCVFGESKPTCANCRIHCYSADMRDKVQAMMRYAGPRMLLTHPLLAIAHLRDGRRPVPDWPSRSLRPKSGPDDPDT